MSQSIADMSALKLAYAAQQLEPSLNVLRAEPIAVIGMGCRFPGGSESLRGYWRLLEQGIDAVGEIPRGRWDLERLFDADPKAPGKLYCRHGSYLPEVEGFDPEFFGITPREARAMDPQQRLILEVAWEALVHAGIDPPSIYGSNTGVVLGVSTFDYAALRLAGRRREAIDPYFVSGTVLSVAAGRLSYTLGINGPSFVVDTACSSSLVAAHQACEALRRRECDLAMAGGVGLILAPEPHIAFCKAGMLAPDGRCKTFDAAANGYGRGEGCGVVVLKRLASAMADGDRILAVIRGSAVNQDGASGGLTVPSGPSQQAVIRAALSRAGLRPESIDYIEAHGTGTPLGDPIELGALGEVFCRAPRPRRLQVGSVKTNFGHLEAAAGMAGLIKIVLAMNHGVIPRHLHFKVPNPKINWEALDVAIPTETTPWTPGGDGKRRAGVSSFGFAGTNAFVALESFASENRLPEEKPVAFRRRRLWMDDLGPIAPPARPEPAETILPGRRQNLPFSDEIRFEARLEAGSPRFVDDHKIYDALIVAGAAHLAYVLEASRAAFGERPLRLARITFLQALTLPPGSCRVAQLIFKPSARDMFTFELVSAPSEIETGDAWVRHVKGDLQLAATSPEAPPGVDVASLCRDREALGGEALYAEIAAMGHHLGPSFRRVEAVWSSGREALCRLRAPQGADDRYRFHPGVLDSCLQWLCIKGPQILFGVAAKQRQGDEVYVPFHIEAIDLWNPAIRSDVLYCHTRVRADSHSDDGVVGDLHLFDERGQSLLLIEGLTVRRLRRRDVQPLRGSDAERWLHRVAWAPRPTAEKASVDLEARHWLLLADADGVAAHLERALIHAGHRVTLVDAAARGPAGADKITLERLFERHGPFAEIVDLTALSRAARSPGDDFLCGCDRALHLVQALEKAPWRPRLRLVTRAGWLQTEPDAIDPTSASLWGLGRVIAREHPAMNVALIDLDGAASVPALIAHCLHDDGEAEIAFKDGRRFVARLEPMPPADHRAVTLSPERTYLITGGAGALGLATAERLVARGARHIVLVGRHAESDEVQRATARMRAAGASVRLERADLGDDRDVRRLMEALRSGGDPPLAGVVHCAGIVDDGLLNGQSAERFARVMAAKAGGAWRLHQHTRDLQLDFFVLFSSMSAVLGRRGQGSYAAANAFLDGLAQLRRSQGLAAVSIQWGGFRDIGMAARMDTAARERLDAAGMGLIPPQTGLDLLESLLTSDTSQVGVFPIDWPRYLAAYGAAAPPFFERVIADASAPPTTPPTTNARPANPHEPAALRRLRAASPAERPELLTQLVCGSLADVMGLDDRAAIDADARLFDIGMDSIMAVALQDTLEIELGVPLSATLVFNYPTAKSIVGFLLDEALTFEARGDEALAVEPERAPTASDDADSGDDELLREAQRLEEKLAQLEKWMDS